MTKKLPEDSGRFLHDVAAQRRLRHLLLAVENERKLAELRLDTHRRVMRKAKAVLAYDVYDADEKRRIMRRARRILGE